MGKGSLNHPNMELPEYSWREIGQHNQKKDIWIVIDGIVYDVSNWCKKHPGGERIVFHHAGQDVTESWRAFHTNPDQAGKYMKALEIGKVKDPENGFSSNNPCPVIKDFRELRKKAEEMGLFKPSYVFFALIMLHIIVLDITGWWVLRHFGTSWIPYLVSAIILATAQAQGGWSQHDYGHLSLFRTSRLNHWTQIFILSFLKGAAIDWWNYRHNIHHAKPNIIRKDPDIRLDYLFLCGNELPVEWGKKKKGFMPYQYQHRYFSFILPPLLFPLYFNYEIPYFLISRRKWTGLCLMMTFFIRWELMYAPMLGFWGALAFFLVVRVLESSWFVWVTQMNHIPMEVCYEKPNDNWVTMQVRASCNIDPGIFNDWFSGHLNFQIEHHLFPTMPRHNLYKIQPLAKSLCKKHNIEYVSKSLSKGFTDILSSLRNSGQLYYDTYYQ